MSGVIKAIGKVFSAVWDFIRPVVEIVAVAAVAYFTVGLALSAFPATQAFAAALPGFASTGGVAGEGVFSSLAGSIGLGGGIDAGATADAAAAGADAATVAAGGASALPIAPTVATADTATGATAAGDTAAGTAAGAAATPLAPYAGTVPPPTVPPPITPPPPVDPALAASNALTNKLLLASVGTQLISGLTAPSPTDIAAAKAGFYGSYYGMDANGSSAPAPDLSVGPQVEPTNTSTVGSAQPLPGINIPAVQAATPPPTQPGFQGVQKAQLIPSVPSGVTPVPGAAASNAVAGTTPLAQPKLITTPASAPPTQPA